MNKSQGFIFLMTLMCTVVISLLLLTSMQHILLYYKAINKKDELHQRFYQLEKVVLHLGDAHFSSGDAGCVSKKDSANQVLQKLIHHKGCFLKSGTLQYRYFIENLGEFSCLVIHKNGQKRATRHRRVSVVQMEDDYPVSLLQVRFIAVGGVSNCLENEHLVRLGVSSWRYFASVDSL